MNVGSISLGEISLVIHDEMMGSADNAIIELFCGLCFAVVSNQSL